MKIYFSGSIRGGRQDANFYKMLIDELKNYGEVLTEHIGLSELKEELSDAEIYARDMQWLKEADILVGEVSRPSHGVGYEIGQAVAMNKKVACLHWLETRISAMISGCPSISCHAYADADEARATLKKVFLNKHI